MKLAFVAEGVEVTNKDPYRALLVAVIERAIDDIFREWRVDSNEARRYYAEKVDALEWVFEDQSEGFGFVEICEYLDYAPDRIRAAIKKELE
jgi:hypothetical protein